MWIHIHILVFSLFWICISVVFEQCFVGRWRCRENWPPDQGAAYFPINAARIMCTMCIVYTLYIFPSCASLGTSQSEHNKIVRLCGFSCTAFCTYCTYSFISARTSTTIQNSAKPIPRALLAHILHGKLIRWSETCIFCFCYHCIFCGDAQPVTSVHI